MTIHVVSFDIPFPADYGGVIDVYYKLLALKRKGVKVYLHCFEYGRAHAKELNACCEHVYYYKRKGFLSALSSRPYIVNSRRSEELKQRLLQDDFPILMEGMHTTDLLDDHRFENRILVYRESNIEHEYYGQLARSEKNFLRRFYFKREASRLLHYERHVQKASLALCVSETDTSSLLSRYPHLHAVYLPSFHPYQDIHFQKEKEKFVLFHGNLSVPENKEAAIFILKQVCKNSTHKLIIAGKNPDSDLQEMVLECNNADLIANPSDPKLDHLMRAAQVHILYTPHAAGLKLKLLNVLFRGGHCLVNKAMLSGTGLDSLCHIAESPLDFRSMLNTLMNQPFTEQELQRRREVLIPRYSNEANVEKLIGLIQELQNRKS